MLRDEKTLKDSLKDTSTVPTPYQADGSIKVSYTKTTKLISALYMVTDILLPEEPIRSKLRTLGAEVVSDISSFGLSDASNRSASLNSNITQIISFLDIAISVNMVTEMNGNILKKEFVELKKSVDEISLRMYHFGGQKDLVEFFREELPAPDSRIEHRGPSTQTHSTRIGVQKGSTLMKALSDRASVMSDRNSMPQMSFSKDKESKRQRRDDIISVIKSLNISNPNNQGHTITDIKLKASGLLASMGEKTLQRELVSMVMDKLLIKTGSKRWSRYFLVK